MSSANETMNSQIIAFSAPEVAAYYASRAPRLSQRGQRWRGRCPVHNGSNPTSFSVNPVTGHWKCFSKCARGGDIFTLEELLVGGSFPERKARIFELVGRPAGTGPVAWTISQAGRMRAVNTMREIAHWRSAYTKILNDAKLDAVARENDLLLSRAARLCNTLENGTADQIRVEFYRHRERDPQVVSALIQKGAEHERFVKLASAWFVLQLAQAATVTEDSFNVA